MYVTGCSVPTAGWLDDGLLRKVWCRLQSALTNWCQIKADTPRSNWTLGQPPRHHVAMALDELGEFPCSSLLKPGAKVSITGGPRAHSNKETHPRSPSGLAQVGSRILLHVTIANVDRKVLAFNEDSNLTEKRHPAEVSLFCADSPTLEPGHRRRKEESVVVDA